MMSKVFGLRTLRLISNNISESSKFYQALFDVEPVEVQQKFVSFLIGNSVLDICLEDDKNHCSTGGSIGYWQVEDLEYFIKKASELGGEIFRGPIEVKETNTKIVQIKDPCGSIIGLEQAL